MKCKSLRESVRVVVLLDDLHAHTHALTLERMQAAAKPPCTNQNPAKDSSYVLLDKVSIVHFCFYY